MCLISKLTFFVSFNYGAVYTRTEKQHSLERKTESMTRSKYSFRVVRNCDDEENKNAISSDQLTLNFFSFIK